MSAVDGEMLKILETSPTTETIFKMELTVAFKANQTLRNLLVRSKLQDQSTTQKNPEGTLTCGHQCFCCPYIINSKPIISHHTQRRFRAKGSGNCCTSGVIYFIQFCKCHLRYVGQTGTQTQTLQPPQCNQKTRSRTTCTFLHSQSQYQ